MQKKNNLNVIKVLSIIGDRQSFYVAVFLSVIGGVIEVVGVSSLYPFLSVLSDANLIQKNAYLKFLYETFNFGDIRVFMEFLGVAALLATLFANSIMFYKNAYIIQYCIKQTSFISSRLLGVYIDKPYLFHVNNNSSELSKNVISQSDQFTNGILLSIMTIFSDGIILFLLIGVVVCISAFAGVVMLIVAAFFLGLMLIGVRKKIEILGRQSDLMNGARYIACQGALNNIKEIKASNSEQFFINNFQRAANKYGNYFSQVSIALIIPQSVIQFSAAGIIIVIALYYLMIGYASENIVPMLAIYGVVGFRLLPSFNRLTLAFSQIEQYSLAAQNIIKEMISINKAELIAFGSVKKNIKQNISIQNLSFSYPNKEEKIIKNLNLLIKPNSLNCIVGSSGSGKTTLIDLILGLIGPYSGVIEVNGVHKAQVSKDIWLENFSYVSQYTSLVPGSLASNIAFGITDEECDFDRVKNVISLCGLDKCVSSLKDGLMTDVGNNGAIFSGGERQRIGIARALYKDSPILILDESTSSLDGINENAILSLLLKLKKTKTIIMIAHRRSTIKNCDRIILMKDGAIYGDGGYDSLLNESPYFSLLMSKPEI